MSSEKISRKTKRFVVSRAYGLCEYCLCPASHSPAPFSVEHIIPSINGGTNSIDNLALSCQGCNNHKYIHIHAKDPLTSQVVRLYDPRTHDWKEHFAWSDDRLLIIGLTQTWRATVDALRLNRINVQNVRKILILAGLHPPAHLRLERKPCRFVISSAA